jgi:hypothetical protein
MNNKFKAAYVKKPSDKKEQNKTTHTQNKRAFKGQQPLNLAIDDVLGPGAKKYCLEHFGWLGESLYLNERNGTHGHAWGAFIRRYFNDMIMLGLVEGRSILDLGASVSRNYSKYPNAWSVCAITDAASVSRDVQFRDRHYDVTEMKLYSRMCRCLVSGKPLTVSIGGISTSNNCHCQTGWFDNYIAIDAVYYEGILEELLYRVNKSRKIAYFTMFDFDKLRRMGKFVANGFDNELFVELNGDVAKCHPRRNGVPYFNKILTTFKDAWQFQYKKQFVLFEIIDNIAHGDLDYVLVRMTPLMSTAAAGVHVIESLFYKPPHEQIQIGSGTLIDPKVCETEKLFTTAFGSNYEGVKFDGDEIILTVKEPVWLWGAASVHLPYFGEVSLKTSKTIYKASLKEVLTLVPKMSGRYSASDVQKNIRSYLERLQKDGVVLTASKLNRLKDTLVLAVHVSAALSGGVLSYVNESRVVVAYKKVVSGLKVIDVRFNMVKFLTFLSIFLALVLALSCVRSFPGVRASSTTGVERDIINSDWNLVIAAFLLAFVGSLSIGGKKRPQRKSLYGICVLDKSRLKLPTGRYDSKVKFYDPTWHPDVIECDAADRPIAYQIAPLFEAPGLALPTIKHPCRKVALAASFRACSNLVHFDPKELKNWQNWFRITIIPKFLSALDVDEVRVNMNVWLEKYPVKYREEMLKCCIQTDWEDEKRVTYDSFPKVEMQFTEVDEEDRETETNTAKERQISGPLAAKKLMANAVINELETLAHKHLPHYCGRKDWPGICKTITDQTSKLSDYVFGAADGSGFDMTQFIPMHQMVDELVLACLDHPNLFLDDPFTKDLVKKALIQSHVLRVRVKNAVAYEAEGRASGDGWTTFGNTVLMMSYWMYTFHVAKIHKYCLLVKGDDVLFAIINRDRQVLELIVGRLFLSKQELVCKGLGQICKFIKFGGIEDMDFLSCYFFEVDGGIRMTRIPARVFQSLPWSLRIPNGCKDMDKVGAELAFAKGNSLLAWSKGLPIWEVLAKKLIELGREGGFSSVREFSDQGRVWLLEACDREAYLSFLSFRFGMGEEAVLAVEKRIQAITSLLEVVELPELSFFFEK